MYSLRRYLTRKDLKKSTDGSYYIHASTLIELEVLKKRVKEQIEEMTNIPPKKG
jgi:hypothetical protein